MGGLFEADPFGNGVPILYAGAPGYRVLNRVERSALMVRGRENDSEEETNGLPLFQNGLHPFSACGARVRVMFWDFWKWSAPMLCKHEPDSLHP